MGFGFGFGYWFGMKGSGSLSAWIALNGDISTGSDGTRYLDNTATGTIPIYANYEDAYTISGTTYYLDHNATGTEDGLSPENAFTTIGLANDDRYSGGDALLIKAGNVFLETSLTMSSSGTSGNHILVGAYGASSLPKPVIDNRRPLDYALVWTAHPTEPNIWLAPYAGSTGRLFHGGTEQVNELQSA